MKQSFYKRHPEIYSILVVVVVTFIVLVINIAAWSFANYAMDNFSERTSDIITIICAFIGAIGFLSPIIFLYERAKR